MEDQILLVGESRPGSRDSVSYIINSSVTTRPLLISGEFSWQGWHDMPDTVKGNSLLCNSLQWITLPLPPVFALPLCILVNQCIFSFCHFCWDWLTCWKSSAISLLKKKKKVGFLSHCRRHAKQSLEGFPTMWGQFKSDKCGHDHRSS